MKKISNENMPEESSVQVMSEEEENKDFGGIEEGQATIFRAALKAASEGIDRGIASDMASEKPAGSILGGAAELMFSPFLLSTPGRTLERGVKGARSLTKSNEDVNTDALKRLQEWVIQPGISLYNSNFSAFIKIMNKLGEKIPSIKVGTESSNDIANIEAMAIDLAGRSLSTPVMSSNSQYKTIIKQVIPIIRQKFDAIASFNELLGGGSKADYKGIAQELYEGLYDEKDIEDLVRFYKAIEEWHNILNVFSASGASSMKGAESKSSGKPKENPSEQEGEAEGSSDPVTSGGGGQTSLAEDIYIHSIRPGQYAEVDPNGSGSIYIDPKRIGDLDTPVIKLFIRGDDKDKVNSQGTGEDYLQSFINKGYVIVPKEYEGLIKNVTRETVSGGSEISLYLRRDILISGSGPSSSGRGEAMFVRTQRGDAYVYVDDIAQVRSLKRVASDVTTSYYQVRSPSGELVSYTPTDLVIGKGKLKDSKGRSFRPKKNIKGKSLSDRVQSKDFGKVRKS